MTHLIYRKYQSEAISFTHKPTDDQIQALKAAGFEFDRRSVTWIRDLKAPAEIFSAGAFANFVEVEPQA